MKLLNKLLITTVAAGALMVTGCKKEFLETNPSNQISADDLFQSTKNAYTLLQGMHNALTRPGIGNQSSNPTDYGLPSVNLADDLMGETMLKTSSGFDWYSYHHNYQATEGANYWMNFIYWTFMYKMINNANYIIDNIDNATGPQGEIDDIKGQALAYRGFFYSELANRFGKHYNEGDMNALSVPLYTEGTNTNTVAKGRSTVKEVFDLVFSDLEKAIDLLANSGVNHPNDKSHISEAAARGMMARIALNCSKWEIARDQAEYAKSLVGLMSRDELLKGFNLASNPEWIWASALTAEQYEGRSLYSFLQWMDDEGPGYASVGAYRMATKDLRDKIPSSDVRSQWFLENGRQKKFRLSNSTSFVGDDLLMRAGEMYLIEAEARYRLNDEAGAVQVLTDLISARYADPADYQPPTSGTALLDEILLQRKIELWGEGFGYEDVRRLNKGLNRPTGSGNFSPAIANNNSITIPAGSIRFIYKIPQSEMDVNPNMVQN